MVRVISEKFLKSPPRSRHSSGETLDKELAARAVEVLSSLNSRRLELSDCESSSDSHWDSEVDVDADGAESTTSRDQCIDGEKKEGTDILRKRTERRRERNKLSAQAYRVRRKEQDAKKQTVLKTLQEDNTRLKLTVQNLEEELKKMRRFLTSTPMRATCPPSTTTGPESSTTTSVNKLTGFGPLPEKTTPTTTTTTTETNRQAMDNDQSRRQQISPVVDNFVFSKSSLPPSPVSGAMNMPSMTSTRSFPTPPVMGARHSFGASPYLATTLPTISEKPDSQFGHQHHHPHPHPNSQLQHQPPADLNANANTLAFTNANTINANVFGLYQNSNMNNNNNLYQALSMSGGEAGARTDQVAQQNPFKMCKV